MSRVHLIIAGCCGCAYTYKLSARMVCEHGPGERYENKARNLPIKEKYARRSTSQDKDFTYSNQSDTRAALEPCLQGNARIIALRLAFIVLHSFFAMKGVQYNILPLIKMLLSVGRPNLLLVVRAGQNADACPQEKLLVQMRQKCARKEALGSRAKRLG
jgi:hypothetical protein